MAAMDIITLILQMLQKLNERTQQLEERNQTLYEQRRMNMQKFDE